MARPACRHACLIEGLADDLKSEWQSVMGEGPAGTEIAGNPARLNWHP